MQVFFELREEQLYVGSMTSHPYPPHMHVAVEIACVLSGSCTVRVDSKVYELSAGDLIMVFPLISHSFDALSEDCSGFAAIFLPDTIAEFTWTFHTLLPDEPVILGATQSSEIRDLINQLMAVPIQQPHPFRLAYLHLLLAHVLQRMTTHPADTGNECSLAVQTIRYIYEHACEKLSLSSVAHALGISKSHLSRLLSTQLRINFKRLINAARINKAIMQMHDPAASLTQIYYGCGYENMRTFRRAFVQETGKLPSDYLRQMRASTCDPS